MMTLSALQELEQLCVTGGLPKISMLAFFYVVAGCALPPGQS
jgi:hypothetical protein